MSSWRALIARRVSVVLVVLGALWIVLFARALLEARTSLARAERAATVSDFDDTVFHLRRAARWGTPLNFYASSALDRLSTIAAAAERRGEPAHALQAYRAMHAAIEASSAGLLRDDAALSRVDGRIAVLMTRERPSEAGAGLSAAEREGRLRALLVRSRPRPWATLLALGGFVTWVSGAIGFFRTGLGADDRLTERARPCLLTIAGGFAVFVCGLVLA